MTFELIKNNAGYANNAAFIKKTFFFVLFVYITTWLGYRRGDAAWKVWEPLIYTVYTSSLLYELSS